MNKKGFTLVELLAVIVILGLLAVVATPAILNSSNKSKQKLYTAKAKIITDSAVLCADDGVCHAGNITVSELINSGYLTFDKNDTKVKNPKNDQDMISCVINITSTGNGRYTAEITTNTEACK